VKDSYSSTLSLTSALDGVGGQTHAPATLPPGMTRYPLYTKLGGPQGRSGRVRKIRPPLEFDPLTVQPVASHYTEYAIPAQICVCARVRERVLKMIHNTFGPSFKIKVTCT
jgi:hypothetical protein